jgi:hypothetical protein
MHKLNVCASTQFTTHLMCEHSTRLCITDVKSSVHALKRRTYPLGRGTERSSSPWVGTDCKIILLVLKLRKFARVVLGSLSLPSKNSAHCSTSVPSLAIMGMAPQDATG